jgi:hypothetical protein
MPSDEKKKRKPKTQPETKEELWPKGEQAAEPEKFFALIEEIADAQTRGKVEKLESEYERAKRIAESNGDGGLLSDMPETVLDGRLGELCERYMLAGKRFPVAYAWPAMLGVASALAPRHTPKQRMNLFVALAGPVHSGKSQAIEAAQQLLGIEAPELMMMMAGSAEALVRRCKGMNGAPQLFSPDELGHLLEKSHIENASFPYVLNRAFYHQKFEVHMGKKEVAEFDASLSILGGIVDARFEDLFSHSTTGGLYDRFLFGACPGDFKFAYFPFEAESRKFKLSEVGVHPDVWIEKEMWLAENHELEPRVCEIAIRAAIVAASFSGKTLLTAKDLGPARWLAEYETRIRRYLRPNEGENPEAKIALKFLAYLKQLGGKYVTKRKLFHDCGAERCGPTIADRALSALHANDDVEVTTKQRPVLVRLLLDEERDGQ